MAGEDDRLIQELRDFHSDHDTSNFSAWDFMYAFGSTLAAAMYAELFWPEFTEVDGVVLRRDVAEDAQDIDRIRRAIAECNGDRALVERNFSRLEVPCGIFSKSASDLLEHQLALKLEQMWKARLQICYPSTAYNVEIEEDPDGSLYIVFYRS